MVSQQRFLLLIGLVAALSAGCGGSGSSGTQGDSGTTAGIDGTGNRSPVEVVSSGIVTGFGSVIVNGVHFDTSNASFTIDDEPGSQSDLAVGDVVTIHGELEFEDAARGTARSVTSDSLVEGPIGAIDVTLGTITVLGQAVRISADTSFDDSIQPASIDGLSVGTVVEISGLAASDGTITATRIEAKPGAVEFELTGIVAALDTGSSRFSLNGQVIDYSAAMLENFDDGRIHEGDRVEVKSGTTLGTGGELLALRVEFEGDDLGADDGQRVELEGLITRFAGLTDFDIARFPVTTNGSPVIEGGAAADLGLDVKVEAEGTLVGGVLVATRIEVRRTGDVRLAANVDSVNAQSSSFVVLGVTIRVDAQTRLEDKGPLDVENFSLTDLRTGDFVEVRGIESPAGSDQVLASLLERDDEGDVELRGIIEAASVANPSFGILGVTVTTSGATVFRDAAGQGISATAFFANAAGRLASVKGIEVADRAITATEVEFE